MSDLDKLVTTFADLEAGDRFRPFPRSGQRVFAGDPSFYTKTDLRDMGGNLINAEAAGGRLFYFAPDARVIRLPAESTPAPAGTHRMRIEFTDLALAALEQRAAETGFTIERLMASMMSEIMEFAGLHGRVVESTFTRIEGDEDGTTLDANDHATGVRDQ